MRLIDIDHQRWFTLSCYLKKQGQEGYSKDYYPGIMEYLLSVKHIDYHQREYYVQQLGHEFMLDLSLYGEAKSEKDYVEASYGRLLGKIHVFAYLVSFDSQDSRTVNCQHNHHRPNDAKHNLSQHALLSPHLAAISLHLNLLNMQRQSHPQVEKLVLQPDKQCLDEFISSDLEANH